MSLALGSVVLGLLNGLTIGLLAVGLVLTYKSNRFLNLAHAQLGTLSALLLAKFVVDWGWSWWVAFPACVAVGVLTGVAVDRLFVQPLRRRTGSPVALLLLTIGVSQLLLGLTFIPALGPNPDSGALYPEPFASDVRVGDVTLTGSSLATLVLVPTLALGLAAFLRFSTLGRQVRAAANNPDAARLCGIPVDRLSLLIWGLAGGFSAVSAILAAPSQLSFSAAQLGPYLLMLTLGAAACGAFVSMPLALAGGVGLGVLGQLVAAQTSDASKATLVLFVATLAIVLLRGQALSRVFGSSNQSVAELAPLRVPPVLASSFLVRREGLLLGGASLLVAVTLPRLGYFDTRGHQFLLTLVLVYAILSVSLTILLGWAGQVSLGHFAVVGIAAYLTSRLAGHGWSLPALLLVAGVIGAATTALIGLPALRVRGLALAVTTLGFAVVTPDWLLRQSWLGGRNPFGQTIPAVSLPAGLPRPDSQLSVYYLALLVLVVVLLLGGALRRSAIGRVIIAVRDNEPASASFGMTPVTAKLTAMAVSGAFAGWAGVLWADAWRVASPTQFGAHLSIALLAAPVIGGLGSLRGAVAGAVVVYMSTFFLGPVAGFVFGDFGQQIGFQLFLAGAGLIWTLQKLPNGLAGLAQGAWQRYLDRRAALVAQQQEEHDPATALVTEGLVVRFGGVLALDAPSVSVKAGEIVGLIGSNGAGKTTLINVVSGTLSPAAGSVRLFGREVVDLPQDLRASYGLARSFQDATLFGGLTVLETIQVALTRGHRVGTLSAMLGLPWARDAERLSRQTAQEVLERFGLGPWAATKTSQLSTGTRRICDLAAQVATGSKLLLLDEPTGGVAQREAEEFGPLLRRVRDELDCAVLLVEHDMPLLMSVCERVYVMEAGRVIASGSPREVRENPLVVASYLGTDSVAVERSGGGRKAVRARPARKKTPVPVTTRSTT